MWVWIVCEYVYACVWIVCVWWIIYVCVRWGDVGGWGGEGVL